MTTIIYSIQQKTNENHIHPDHPRYKDIKYDQIDYNGNTYIFDRVLTLDSLQSDLYEYVEQIVLTSLYGLNTTIAVCGCKNAGQLNLFHGNIENSKYPELDYGLVPRIINTLLDKKSSNNNLKIYMHSSGVFIYDDHHHRNKLHNNDSIISLTFNDVKNVILSTKEPFEVEKNIVLKRNEITKKEDYFNEFKNSYYRYCELIEKNKSIRSHYIINLTLQNGIYSSEITLIMSDNIKDYNLNDKYDTLLSKMLYKRIGCDSNTIFTLCADPFNASIKENEEILRFGRKCREIRCTPVTSNVFLLLNKIRIESNKLKDMIKEYEDYKNYMIISGNKIKDESDDDDDDDVRNNNNRNNQIQSFSSSTSSSKDTSRIEKPSCKLPLPLLDESNNLIMRNKDFISDSIEFIEKKENDIEDIQQEIQKLYERLHNIISTETVDKLKIINIYRKENERLKNDSVKSTVPPPFVLPPNHVVGPTMNSVAMKKQEELIKEYKQKTEEYENSVKEYKNRINYLEKKCEEYENKKQSSYNIKENGKNIEQLLLQRDKLKPPEYDKTFNLVEFYCKKNNQSPFAKLTIEQIMSNLNNERLMDVNLFNDIEIFFPIKNIHQNNHSVFYNDEIVDKLKKEFNNRFNEDNDELLRVTSYFLYPYGIVFDYETYECEEIQDGSFLQKFIVNIQLDLDKSCVYPFIILLHYIFCCLADFGETGSLENIKEFIKSRINIYDKYLNNNFCNIIMDCIENVWNNLEYEDEEYEDEEEEDEEEEDEEGNEENVKEDE